MQSDAARSATPATCASCCPRLRIVADASGAARRPVLGTGVICQSACVKIELEGVALRRRGLAVRGGSSRVVCDNVHVYVTGPGSAVSVQGGASLDMTACRIRARRGHGLSVIGVGTSAKLQGTKIERCGRSGVWAYMGARVEIESSDISRCDEFGLHAQGSEDFPSRMDVKRAEGEGDSGSLFVDNARGDWFEQSGFDRIRWC